MSLWDRIGKAASTIKNGFEHLGGAAYQFVRAPVGLVGDIATSPWNDDQEYNGVLNTLSSSLDRRFGSFAGESQQAFSGIVGGGVQGVDILSGGAAGKALEGAQWMYSNLVSQPIATLQLAGRQPGDRGYNTWDLLLGFDPSRIPQAWDEAQHTSPDRGIVARYAKSFGVDQYDISTADGVNNTVKAVPGGSFYSGAVAFAENFFLDPTVIGGKAVRVARIAGLTKPVTSTAKAEKIAVSTRTDNFLDRLFSHDTPEKRMAWLSNQTTVASSRNPAAPALIRQLATSEDQETARAVLRLAMDPSQMNMMRLQRQSAFHANRMYYLMDQHIPHLQNMIDGTDRIGFVSTWRQMELKQARDMVVSDKQVAADLARDAYLSGSLRQAPRMTWGGRLSEKIGWTNYQPSIYNVPMRVAKAASNYRVGVVNYHEPDSWINVKRFLDQTGVDQQTKGKFLLQWTDAAARQGNEATKTALLEQMETAGANAVGARLGLDPDLVKVGLAEGKRRRSELAAQVADPRYSAVKDADGRYLDMMDFNGDTVRMPIFVTQLKNYHPFLDVQEMTRVLSRYSSELKGEGHNLRAAFERLRANQVSVGIGTAFDETANALNNIWKPMQLLRLGYPVRNISDEGLRMYALLGVLNSLPMQGRAYLARHAEKSFARRQKNLAILEKKITNGRASPVEIEVAARLREEVEAHPGEMLFNQPFQVHSYTVEGLLQGAQGGPRRAAISARDTMRNFAEDYGAYQTRLRQEAGRDWIDSNKPEDWRRAVNGQIRADPIGMRILEGQTDEQVVEWLRREGREYRESIGGRGVDPYRWVREMRTQIDHYIPSEALQQLAAKRNLTIPDLERVVGRGNIPHVNAQDLDEARRKSFTHQIGRRFVDKAMDKLGAVPDDVFVRHPFAALSYKKKLVELIDAYDPKMTGDLTPQVLRVLEQRARAHATRQVQEMMYDLVSQPNLARTMRFMMPFYGAWSDMITKWTKIFVDDPSRIGRALQMWEIPDKLGWVHKDEFGDEVVVMKLPESIQKYVPGAKALGGVSFTKQALVPMLSGANPFIPGSGPLVSIGVAEIVRDKPNLADSVKFILPFGPGDSLVDQLAPAYLKRVRSLTKGTDDRAYANSYARIFGDLLYERNIGKNNLSDAELVKEAQRRTRSFYMLRTMVNLISPAIPQYRSPYEFFWRKAREYREKFGYNGGTNGNSWETQFLRDYGEDFFPFTEAFSKATASVAPTENGFKATKAKMDLISQFPNLEWLIVGDDDDSGKFSRAVYEWQFRTTLGPGGPALRRPTTGLEMIKDQATSLGWNAWINGNREIENMLQQRGLTDVGQPGAEDLAEIKTALRLAISDKYPDWEADYNNRPEASDVVHQIERFAYDKRFDTEPGFKSLRDYLQGRRQVIELLRARDQAGGSLNLQAKENGDLLFAWKAFVGQLRQLDPAFQSIWDRALDYDLMERGT